MSKGIGLIHSFSFVLRKCILESIMPGKDEDEGDANNNKSGEEDGR